MTIRNPKYSVLHYVSGTVKTSFFTHSYDAAAAEARDLTYNMIKANALLDRPAGHKAMNAAIGICEEDTTTITLFTDAVEFIART